MAMSPEEVLANAMAPVQAAVHSYGEGQVNLAQQQFMNQLRQEAEARKNQYELGQIQLTGKLRGENDLATQALRNSGELEQVAARGASDLSNKKELLPLEHKNRLEEIDQTAKAFLARMDESEKAKLRQTYAGMGFRQAPGENDDDFLLRVNKGVADHANKLFSTISENDGRAQALLTAETQRLKALAMDRATKEWATTLDSTGKKLLMAGKSPDEIINLQKDKDKRANMAAGWSETFGREQEKAKTSMDPSIAHQINSIKYLNQHLEGALTKTLEDKSFQGATPFLKFNAPAAAGKTDAQKMADVFGVGVKTPPPVTQPVPGPDTPSPESVLGVPAPQRQVISSGRGNNSSKFAVASIDDEMNGIDHRLAQIQSRGGLNTPVGFNEGKALVQRKAALAAQRAAIAGSAPQPAMPSPQDVFGIPNIQRSTQFQPPAPSDDFFSSPQLQNY